MWYKNSEGDLIQLEGITRFWVDKPFLLARDWVKSQPFQVAGFGIAPYAIPIESFATREEAQDFINILAERNSARRYSKDKGFHLPDDDE